MNNIKYSIVDQLEIGMHSSDKEEPVAALFILSLCSDRLSKFFLENKELHFLKQIEHCTFVHLSNLEIDNMLFFENLDFQTAKNKIEERAVIIKEQISTAAKRHNTTIDVLSGKDIKKEIKAFQIVLDKAYAERGLFFRSVNNQIFQNLHPKLKRQGIKNSRSPFMRMLSPFLLTELATLLYYSQKEECNHNILFSTCPPMQVFQDILVDKFNLPLQINNKDIKTEHILKCKI